MLKRQKGLLAVLLACVMTIGSALPASAAEPQNESQTPAVRAVNDGLELSKSISLKDNGNYELKLEAYATGKRTTTTVTTKQPLDIILVLDQSGSMADNFGSGADRTRKQTALKNAVDNFIDAIYADSTELDGKEGDVEHRLGIITYGSNSSVLAKFGSVESGYTTYVNRVDGLPNSPSGATNTGAGMTEANGMLQDREQTEGRKSVVVLFTDGVPTESSIFDADVANTAINQANQMKNNGATVYTVGIFNGADTSYIGDIRTKLCGTDNESDLANRFMNLVSSKTTTATNMGATNEWHRAGFLGINSHYDFTITNNFDYDSTKTYYKTAESAGELNGVFDEISTELPSIGSDVQLDANSLLRDVVDTDNFRLPANMDSDDVTITLIPGTRATNESEVEWDLNAEAAPKEFEDENFNITALVNSKTSTVDVTGFSYQDYYIAPGHPGYKLVVKFEVQALHAGNDMTSNTTASAIYKERSAATLVKPFEVPQVTIAENTYVLDFGKKVEVAKAGAKYVKAEPNAPLDAATMTTYDTTDGYFAVEGSGISYQPQTTNWASIDTGYVFGDNSGNYWEAESFLPATSVYYEDDFGYTSEDRNESGIAAGYTTIKYDGNWSIDKAGQASGDTQSSDNVVYGTDTSYDNNYGYSNGSATGASKAGAKATFTFTGTGLDIYTSTNSKSGLVLAQIKGQNHGKIYTAIIDNEFVSNGEIGLYQIPTISFQNVVRDTYDVTLTVGSDTDGNSTYYLDAIRVYNPIEESDPVVSDAYTEAGEANSKTVEVRDELIDAGSLGTVDETTAGVAYIDMTKGSTANIDQYEDYGPKNEVYIEPGKGIAFQLGEQNYEKVFLGIKAPEGQSSVDITAGNETLLNKDITSATDMYYEIKPTDEGYVVIENTGNKLISITKLRVTGVTDTDTQDIELQVTPELMSYAASFASLPYVDEVENPDENTGDVIIENPEVPETETPSDTETGHNTVEDVITNVVNSLWNSIWNGFSSWFSRW